MGILALPLLSFFVTHIAGEAIQERKSIPEVDWCLQFCGCLIMLALTC